MAYIPSECSLEEYEKVIYSGDAKHRLYVKHGDTVIGTNGDNNASPFASKLTVKRRILKNGSKTFTLNNFVSQEVELVLHDYKIENLSEEIEIKIGTYIDSIMDYVYVPIGKFLIQDNPTTDKNKTTYKLRDFSVKFDFYYNGKPLIDANGGSVTKIQILQDICKQAGVNCYIQSFIGFDDKIGIYDNSITARMYISYLAEQAGCIAYINRKGELDFKTISSNDLIERNIDSSIIEKFKSGDSFKVSKVLYESGIIKFENGTNDYDTLYISADNPYIANQQQLDRILPSIVNFEINSFETGKVLGNPTIDPFDLIKVEYNNVTYKTLAQYTLNFSGTMTSSYSTKIEHETKQSNIISNGTSTIKKYVKTEIDNVEAELKIEIGDFEDDTNNKLLSVTGRVDKLESSISDVADLTISEADIDAKVELNNINESEPIRLVVRPIGESISNLLISNNMLIDNNFKLKQRVIRFTNTNTNEIFDYPLPDDLWYYDSENYDEFILDYEGQSCVINKKVGINEDGTTYLLEKPTTVEYDYPTGDKAIVLTDGNYIVEILGYDTGYIFARLMAKTIITTQFYTKAETDSKISQTSNKISTEIDAKFSNYSTTTEMNNIIAQEITDSENNINMEVSKKVNTDEVIAKINLSPEAILISANKINIVGVLTAINNDTTTTINGNKIRSGSVESNNYLANTTGMKINLDNGTIDSKNFKLLSNGDVEIAGKITATSGTIGGCSIVDNVLQIKNANITSLSVDKISSGTNSNNITFNGKIICTNAEITGKVTATSGTIGGWNVSDVQLQKTIGNYTFEIRTDRPSNEPSLLVYDTLNSRYNWYVRPDGYMYSRNANISGTINAKYGNIGKWSISDGELYGSSDGYEVSLSPGYLYARAPGDTWEHLRWYSLVFQFSDKNVKNNIKNIEEKYNILFDNLKPVTFKYKDEYETRKLNLTHIGFVAQDIQEAQKEAGLEDLSLIYGEKILKLDKQEIIALNTWQIQRLKKIISSLELKITKLEEKICQ